MKARNLTVRISLALPSQDFHTVEQTYLDHFKFFRVGEVAGARLVILNLRLDVDMGAVDQSLLDIRQQRTAHVLEGFHNDG